MATIPKHLMWSVIQKIEDNEYDVVPNTWLCSEAESYFPTHINLHQATKLVKNGQPYEPFWEKINVKIKKRNYESYNRAMTDAIRFSKKKKSMSSSENETKGKRIPKKPVLSDENSINSKDSDSETSSHSQFENFTMQTPPLPMIEDQQMRIPTPPSSLGILTHTNENLSMKCNIAKGKNHSCAFTETPLTLQSLGHTLCGISRQIEQMNKQVKAMQQEVLSRLSELNLTNLTVTDGIDAHGTTIFEDSDEENDKKELLKDMPFTDFNQFMDFDNKLKTDKSFYHKIVSALQSVTTNKSPVKAARNIVSSVINPTLCCKFSWRGVQRKDQTEKKEAFKNLHFCHLLFRILKNMFTKLNFEDMNKIEISLSNYLAQTGSLAKQKLQEP